MDHPQQPGRKMMQRAESTCGDDKTAWASNTTQRPFTTIGSSIHHLNTKQGMASATPPTHQRQRGNVNGQVSEIPQEPTFDVRKFLLDQHVVQPLHQSSLFRASGLLDGAFDNRDKHSAIPIKRDAKRKKLLPKMEMDRCKSANALMDVSVKPPSKNNNQKQGDHDPQYSETITHFYTVEKLAEACYHAVQGRNKTWQFLPGSEERAISSRNGTSGSFVSGSSISLTRIERPSRRVDLLDLEKCFNLATQFVKTHRHDGDVAVDAQFAMIDRDIVSIQTRIEHSYGAAVATTTSTSPELTTLPPPLTSETRQSSVEQPLNQDYNEVQPLVRIFFLQKWSDLILGELEAMLMTSFLEQGVLQRKARIQYAQVFSDLEKLYGSRCSELHNTREDLARLRLEITQSTATHELTMHAVKQEYESEIKRLTQTYEVRSLDMEHKLAESKDQVTKMSDTMKTLNTIFRQMREDTERVKAVELYENFIKLEKKCEQYKEEVEQLRPLVQQNHLVSEQLATAQIECQTLKDTIVSLETLVASKDSMIANLMEQQSDLIASQELRTAQLEELLRRAAEDAEEEDADDEMSSGRTKSSNEVDELVPEGISTKERSQPLRRAGGGVCVRCKRDLRQMSIRGGVIEVSNEMAELAHAQDSEYSDFDGNMMTTIAKKKRMACLHFRILLPNFRGRRPQREVAWTFSCIRSIIFAKQIDDAMCRRSGGCVPLRVRMPEFVYAWFSPWRSIKDEKYFQEYGTDPENGRGQKENSTEDDIITANLTPEQKQFQSDEDRWCLYYGVKALVHEGYLEAKLFLSLLDEKYGEDEQVFMLYCYRILDILIGGRLNWGPLREVVSYEQFSKQYEQLYGEDTAIPPEEVKRVPKTVWISVYHASMATGVVLSKATESERVTLDKKILEFAVTNLPEEDRPTIFLTPITSIPKSNESKHLNHHHVDDQYENQSPEQFVDANLWVELMMMEYKEEQTHRRAAIRLMFQTATASSFAVADYNNTSIDRTQGGLVNASAMDMEQFRIMIRALNDEMPSHMIATLFRNAYDRGNGAVNFDSFMDAAESAQFFSSCMRLDSPASSIARLAGDPNSPTVAVLSTSSRAASMVHKYFTLLRQELAATIAAQPLWSRSVTDFLSYEVSSSLMDGEGTFSDGLRLLTSFHRLLDNLMLSKLVKHEITGALFASKNIASFEKALRSLLDCMRQRDKTTVEILIETVQQKLCVKRVQAAFRKYLEEDEGAPLVIRPLLHHGYGNRNLTQQNKRRTMRPLSWLLFAISDILRQSIKSVHVTSLVNELSALSSAFDNLHRHSSHSANLNGGIGPAPKPIFMELIYDYFLEKFGTRWEAEKIIHDVFVSCRSPNHRKHPLVHLFRNLCCMNGAELEDRLLGQNEALAFLHGIFRSGEHRFHVVNPPSRPIDGVISSEEDRDGINQPEPDLISFDSAQKILLAAFSNFGAEQKQRLRNRLQELLIPEPAHRKASLREMRVRIMTPSLEANEFLVLAMDEWKRYILHRMNEVRVICCALEDEMTQFETLLQIDTIASVLQKANITFSNEDLCTTFRRLCATQSHKRNRHPLTAAGSGHATPHSPQEPMSDRLAAACFPLLAREAFGELQQLEHAAEEPFKLASNAIQSYEFLIATWNGYHVRCSYLLEELRRLGKNNDIQAESIAHRTPLLDNGIKRQVLYLSSSSSAHTLSSQDVAQLDALYVLFQERLDKLTQEMRQIAAPGSRAKRGRLISVAVLNGDVGSTVIVEDHRESGNALVQEAWKMLRQVLVGFLRLRAMGSLGTGALPDDWDAQRETLGAQEAVAMVVAPLPMVKLGGLVIRTLTKPLAKVVKARSKIHPGLNSVCHSLGQRQHRLLIRFHMGYRGIENYVIKDIPAEQAVEKGADIIGEVIIFSVALAVATFEYQRSATKSKETERKQQELKTEAEREIEERFEKLETQVLFLETKLAELGHIMEAGLTERIHIATNDDNVQQAEGFVDSQQPEGFVVAKMNRVARPRRA